VIEFSLVVFVLSLLLFGIIEFGLIFRDKATLQQAAREAARSLSLSSSPTVATNRAISTATSVTLASSMITLSYQTPDSSGNVTSTGWTTLANTSTTNPASSGDLMKCTVTYSHKLIAQWAFYGNASSTTLHGDSIFRKE
jgi:Flp pilus assembly protein TadG